MLNIQNCSYIKDYELDITFNNGYGGLVNLRNEVLQEPYTELKDVSIFKQFYIDHGAICWLDGKIDMATEYLFYIAHKHDSTLHNLFQKWGYC